MRILIQQLIVGTRAAVLPTQGYASLNCPMTNPEYVATIPSPRMRRNPGTSPTVASTEGSDSMPSEIVSAIMTFWDRQPRGSSKELIELDAGDSLMPACLRTATTETLLNATRLRSTHHHSRVLYLHSCQYASRRQGISCAHLTSPSSSSPKGSCWLPPVFSPIDQRLARRTLPFTGSP